MSVTINSQVGVQSLATGVPQTTLRATTSGGIVTGNGGAVYQEAVLSGRVFCGANAAGTAVTTQAGLSVTTPALVLYNPVGSDTNLVLWSFSCTFTAAPAAAAAVMLAYNFQALAGVPTGPVTVTAATVTNAFIGYNQFGSATAISNSAGSVGQCYRVSTLSATPVTFRYSFGTSGAAAIGGMSFRDEIGGAVIIPPGIAISVQTTSAAAVLCDFIWEEKTRQ